MSDDANGTTGGLRGLVLGYQDFTNGLVGADSALDDSREGIKNIDTALAQMASSGQAVEAAKALEEMKEAIADRGGNVDGFVDSLGGYEEALAKAADEQAKFNEELEQFQTLTSMATSLSFAEDMRSLQSALKESGGAMGYGEEGAKSLGIALKMATGFGEGFNKELENLKQSGQDSAESIAAAGAKYVKMGTDFAATIPNTQKGREVIDGLNEAMADVPNWVPVQVSLTGGKSADKQIKKIAQSIGMTPKQLQLSIAENGGKPTEAQIKRIAKATGMKQKDILIAIGLTGAPKAVGEAGKAGKQTGSAAAKGAASTKGEALASGKTLGTATAKGAASTVGEARDTGQQVGNALNTGTVAGIQQSVGSAIAAAASAGARVAQAYKDAAKVKSPSQVTIYVGQMLNAGLVRGIQSSGQAAVNAAHGVVNSVSGVYSSAAQASAVAVAEQWASFHESARVEGMNTERFKKKIKKKDRVKGKKNWEWATRNTGRGDAWKAGRDAAKSYAEGIANAAQEAAKAAAQLRVRTAEALTSSGRGDFTQAKSSGSAKAWIARQLKMVLGFKKNLQTLASAGLPQYMLQDMIARGVDAAPLAASLVRADAATFNQIASQGAALQLASQNLGAVGSSLYLDRQASMGVKAAPGSQPGSIAVYIGGQKINEIVGVEVDGQVKQLANQVVYG
jgi:DNA-binding phage protein